MDYPNSYQKIYLVCAPQLSGRNFLINALSLSDQCVLRNAILATKQLDGTFGYQHKLAHIKQKLNEARDSLSWDVDGPSCARLYGVTDQDYTRDFHEILKFKFDPIVDRLIAQDKTLFLVVPKITQLPFYRDFWPNASVLFFVGFERFDQYRRSRKPPYPKLIEYWNTVKGTDWPEHPPADLAAFELLPAHIKQELKINFNFEIQRWFNYTKEQYALYHQHINQYLPQTNYYCWDVDANYFDQTTFLDNFQSLTQWLSLDIPNINDVKWYYNEWQQTIKHILSDNKL